MYTIVDIETTGNGINGNKITEISIFKYDGHRVVEEFTSLVNPECEIPLYITGLTGIDNFLVRNAPTFREINEKVASITADAIFVAHSVNFDYHVIKNEFRAIGIDFVRKKLCTVRLSRKILPGYHSYSLGKLCSALRIPLKDRHRARGDAHATLLLFQMLVKEKGAAEVIKLSLNARSQEATLPPSLPGGLINKLPGATGIYRFKNDRGQIIYVGKAINIRKRVLGHFYDKSTREVAMCRETADVEFELSGGELLALLMESAEIKRHYPMYNRAQKRKITQYAICSYEDRNGILHLAYNQLSLTPAPLMIFTTISDCRTYLEEVCRKFGLCAKYCHLQEKVPACFHYKLNTCHGICRGEETSDLYNPRVEAAIRMMSSEEDCMIKEKGRDEEEDGIILLRRGEYYGYGFVPRAVSIDGWADILPYISPQKNTVETQRLVMACISKHPELKIRISIPVEQA